MILPSLTTNVDSVDFGTCFVGQRREAHVTLENRTSSASRWVATVGERLPLADPGDFGVGVFDPMFHTVEDGKQSKYGPDDKSGKRCQN